MHFLQCLFCLYFIVWRWFFYVKHFESASCMKSTCTCQSSITAIHWKSHYNTPTTFKMYIALAEWVKHVDLPDNLIGRDNCGTFIIIWDCCRWIGNDVFVLSKPKTEKDLAVINCISNRLSICCRPEQLDVNSNSNLLLFNFSNI